MNLGLKKPRKGIPAPKPYVRSKALKEAETADTGSYLPPDGKKAGKKSPRRAGNPLIKFK